MLDLEIPERVLAGVDLAGDSDDPFLFYALPPAPRVALDAGGAPRVRLLRLVRDGQLRGGHLELAVAAAHAPAALDAARAALTDALRDTQGRVRVVPATVAAGQAELLFVGRETDAEGATSAPLYRTYGTVVPLLDPPHTASFSVPLGAAQAQLVEAALRSGASPVGVLLRLVVEALRPSLRVVAHVDWRRVYDHVSSEVRQGDLISTDDVTRLSEKLVESKAVEIRAVQALAAGGGAGEGAPMDMAPALAFVEREIVERCFRPILPLERQPARASLGAAGEMFGVGAAWALKAIEEVERVTADLDLQVRAVVRRTLAVQAHLADLLGGAAPGDHIEDAGTESPFFARVALHLTTAQPLGAAFVREVIAHFQYGPTEIPVRLAPGSPEGSAETWADQAPDHTWRLPLDVTLADDAPVEPGARVAVPALSGQSRELALDLPALLGLRAIEVWGAADARVVASRVEVAQRRAGAVVAQAAALTLTPAAPRGTLWLRDVRPGDRLEATVRHMLADGRLLDVAPFAVDTRVVRLPPPFPGAMTIELVASDDWSDLQRVVVSLQKQADMPAGVVTLAAAGASAAVSLDLPDPADRRYRYKMARTTGDGSVEEDNWAETDRSVLLVGRTAVNVLVVDVQPVGPELPEAGVNTIEVELLYVDPVHQIRSTPTAVLRARADTYHWVVPLADPSLKTYQYRVTVHRNDGTTRAGPWLTASDRLLLVPVTRT